jgi:hypothetical protein
MTFEGVLVEDQAIARGAVLRCLRDLGKLCTGDLWRLPG